jgi:hypothetical protein
MRYWKWLASFVVAAGLAAGTGCQSTHEEGVKSNLRTQWTDVNASTEATTQAAQFVLESEGLKEVKGKSTSLDGTASGKMADGTKVTVDVKKMTDRTSKVSVTVGAVGNPKLGAEMAKKIKMHAEGHAQGA